MKLIFRNITLELNVFNIERQPRDDGEVHQMNLIETITKQQEEDSVERYLEIQSAEIVVHDEEAFVLGSCEPKFKELPPVENQALPSIVQPPKLDLKPLLSTLNMIMWGVMILFQVVISSSFLLEQ